MAQASSMSHIAQTNTRNTTYHATHTEFDVVDMSRNQHNNGSRVLNWRVSQAIICKPKSFCEGKIAFEMVLSIGGDPLLSSGSTRETKEHEERNFSRDLSKRVMKYTR